MCDQQSLRSACAYIQSDHSLCLSFDVQLLTEHHLEFLSLKGGRTGWSESTLVKMPHCWKSHVTAHLLFVLIVINILAECINYNTWNSSCFTPLDAPQSPSMTLQWTIRDNEVINLPTVLLVKGDIIYLRPGQTAPATCKEILVRNLL